MRKKLFIVIPAFNEEKTIGKLIKKLQKNHYKNIVVIDDCSVDKTAKIAEDVGAIVLKHIINRGVGGAWRTGFAYALNNGADYIVTMDADLQHKVEEIDKILEPIINKKADIVIGKRQFQSKKMPLSRKIGNQIANIVNSLLFGLKVSDSQSGFRAFNKSALQKMRLVANKMEICSEMIGEIKKNKLHLIEVPISTVYTKYSLSKGQSFKNGLKTLIRLIVLRFR